VVRFYADWCGVCEKLAPHLHDLAAKNQDRLLFLEVDVEKNEYIVDKYEVLELPRMICFKNGAKVSEIFGSKEESYTEWIKKIQEDQDFGGPTDL